MDYSDVGKIGSREDYEKLKSPVLVAWIPFLRLPKTKAGTRGPLANLHS